ncbi:MAG: sigma-70 family RNA polymerase sigma factor [Nitrospira sp.]|nr:sigma-70 family RNA polymerase sigma factor [Nitrospira sp.]
MTPVSPHAASTIAPALLARVAKGEQQALSQLYDLSSTLLFSIALRILGHREEAAELLQEVYLEIWSKVVRYDVGRGTPIAWLITLTRSRAIDRLRMRGTRTRPTSAQAVSSPTTPPLTDYNPPPVEAQADQELRTHVSNILSTLPQAQQQAIELAYYEGLSHTEISVRLNQPVESVKTRLKLGMAKLRESLRHDWVQNERP